MKALKDFDYNLWTTGENGVKKYFVGIKATGEVTEVDAEVMKLLRKHANESDNPLWLHNLQWMHQRW